MVHEFRKGDVVRVVSKARRPNKKNYNVIRGGKVRVLVDVGKGQSRRYAPTELVLVRRPPQQRYKVVILSLEADREAEASGNWGE